VDRPRLEKVARDGFWTDGAVDDHRERADRCLGEKADLPE
jgi:hypothetical protein